MSSPIPLSYSAALAALANAWNIPSSDAQLEPTNRRRTLTPIERALCRVLRNIHEIDIKDIAARTGWSVKVVSRASLNDYSPPDVVADDAALIAGSPEHAQLVEEMVRDQESGTPSLTTTPRAAAAASSSSAAAAVPSAHSTRHRAPKATPGNSFLAKFIRSAALGPEYQDIFVAAEVTEDTLRRMVLLDEAFAQDFLRGLVPESSASDRVLFATAVRRLV
ncbi:hypothetical protein FB451DRAFT_1568388 [Mycena latifolia]|nr:hypothetical protein FB451DRAFT_1568388 [Mycena latifolia]